MTYLELINKVLVRLRENEITSAEVDSNPYFKIIGAHVNDAKRQVEDAWQWTQLRSYENVSCTIGQRYITIPDTADIDITFGSVKLVEDLEEKWYMRWVSHFKMDSWHMGNTNNDRPGYYSFYPDDDDGNKQIDLWPIPDDAYVIRMYIYKQQADLVNAEDRMKVPSLPVYLLALALASRERGEVGGTPTSELFVMADRALADAIAYDSARVPEEIDWISSSNWHETNVRTG